MDGVPVENVDWANTELVIFRSAELEISQELQVLITTGLVNPTGQQFDHGHRKLHMIHFKFIAFANPKILGG